MAKNCGHNVPCGCGDTYLTTPAPCGEGIECSGTECSEIFSTNCIIYTGEDIDCSGTPLATNGQTLNEIIENICTIPSTPSDFIYNGGPVDCDGVNLAISGDTIEIILGKICDKITSMISSFNILQPAADSLEIDNFVINGSANTSNIAGDITFLVDRINCNNDIIINIISLNGITFNANATMVTINSDTSSLSNEWTHPTGLPAGSYPVILLWTSCGITKTQNITFNLT